MALWDYHAPRGGPSYVGLTDDGLARVKQKHPGGRVIQSVHHLPRMPGDDETDHILRHRYGIDPGSYRGTYEPRARAPKAPASKPRARASSRPKPIRRMTPSPRAPFMHLSRLVRVAVVESPVLERQLERFALKHLRSGQTETRHTFIDMPLRARTRRGAVHFAFANER